MQTVSTSPKTVTVRAERAFMSGGHFVEPGQEIQAPWVDACYLESTGKGKIVSEPDTEPAPDEDHKPAPVAKKGKNHA